jgi:hypothetical protein
LDGAPRDRVATVRGFLRLLSVTTLAGCSGLAGLGGPTSPLVAFDVKVTGDLATVQSQGNASPALRVALVWGAQWQTEPFCILPAESVASGAVIAAGCRDPFGFVPLRVAADVPVTVGATASVPLYDLPAADVMVGPVTARVAYGSMVIYDDRNGNGTLELSAPHHTPSGGDDRGQGDEPADSTDVVFGASFITMTAPDQRVAFREGQFIRSAFYPRSGCEDPMLQFSVLGAGGFSAAAGLASKAGSLPAEDPTTCTQTAPSAALFEIPLQSPAGVHEVACTERANDSTIRYRQPPTDAPDLSGRLSACAHLPSFDAGGLRDLTQFVVSGRTTDLCEGLTHYTLRGCRENVSCPVPDWDLTATPPAWWPCPP